jgi:hypothetical protein
MKEKMIWEKEDMMIAKPRAIVESVWDAPLLGERYAHHKNRRALCASQK